MPFGRITLLTGANSSGKSSVIYGVLGAIQSGEFPFQFWANGKYVDMGDYKEIANQHNINNDISIEFAVEDNQSLTNIQTQWHIDIKTKQPKLKQLKVESHFYNLTLLQQTTRGYILNFIYKSENDPIYKSSSDEAFLRRRIQRELGRPPSTVRIGIQPQKKVEDISNLYKELNEKYSIKDRRISKLASLFDIESIDTNTKLRRAITSLRNLCRGLDNSTNYLSSFRQPPSRNYYEQSKIDLKIQKEGGNYEHQIISWENVRSKKFKELNQVINDLNLFEKIKSKRKGSGLFEIRVKTNKSNIDASITDVGFGISQFIPIIVGDIQLENDSTLYVSQPETHLHPSIQANFGDFLVNRISHTQKNYVVETHSEYLLNRLRLAIVKGTLTVDDIKIYYLSNNGKETKVHDIQFLPDGQIKGAPKDFFETYLIDVMDIALEASAR